MKTSNLKINFYTCYLGWTGYAQHARNFTRALSKYADISICTDYFDPNWNYDELDQKLISNVVIDRKLVNIRELLPNINWSSRELYPDEYLDIDIVLFDEHHWLFYDTSMLKAKIKMAFMVWESTEVRYEFFSTLNRFDYLIVVTQWHKEMIIKQGFDANRVIVINEGVNDDVINTKFNPGIDKFRYLIAGKWEFRKYTREMVMAFQHAFPKGDPEYSNIELLISADNPFAKDGFRTTNECLKYYGLEDDRIKVLNFPPRDEYLKILSSCNVFLSCSRSEGWGIPLCEAMTLGLPCIYSNYGAQLEYAQYSLPVNWTRYIDAEYTNGCLIEPDYMDLIDKIKDAFINYDSHLNRSIEYSAELKDKFNWDVVAKDAIEKLSEVMKININTFRKPYSLDFRDGARVSIIQEGKYLVKFINENSNTIEYSTILTNGMFGATNKKYYLPWKVTVINLDTDDEFTESIDLTDKNVLIKFESGCLGDTLAWIPYAEEFRSKHNCKVDVYVHHKELLSDSYPKVNLVDSINESKYYAIYRIGWYANGRSVELNKMRTLMYMNPLQKTAADILGLDFKEIRPIAHPIHNLVTWKVPEKPYVCLAIQSTSKRKLWNNPNGWSEITDYFISKGYEVHVLSNESNGMNGIYYPENAILHEGNTNIHNTSLLLKGAKLFIGIGSGLSWLAWALRVPTVLVSGFSTPECEMSESDDVLRVYPDWSPCKGCFNREYWDRSWDGCPKIDKELEDFICTKSITSDYVIEKINQKFGI